MLCGGEDALYLHIALFVTEAFAGNVECCPIPDIEIIRCHTTNRWHVIIVCYRTLGRASARAHTALCAPLAEPVEAPLFFCASTYIFS